MSSLHKKAILVLLLFLLTGGSPASSKRCIAAASHEAEKKELYKLIGSNDSLYVTNGTEVILEKNETKKLVPASILKILTSLMCVHYLGRDFRFKTDFYIDNANLYIRGSGDPLITSEIMPVIAEKIASSLKSRLQHNKIRNIIIDTSFFSCTDIPGITDADDQPYNAPVSALGINFNSINFLTSSKGELISAESQTPLIPFSIEKIRQTGYRQGRIILEPKESPLYFGYMLKYYLEKNNTEVTGAIKTDLIIPKNASHLYQYVSEFSLETIISKLLTFSNNYIANQLFLTAGTKKFREPATLKKSVNAMAIYTKDILLLKDLQIVEGSGISRKNKISAQEMNTVLKAFADLKQLMKKKNVVHYKTGTLEDVSTRAGYINIPLKKQYQYVIILNTKGKSSLAIEEKLVEFLIKLDF
jgi:D-alanyl-D-alanine carboxypeptidase/D-alanyl-D-alanine-endopeptidase (penicillin-binding protein 4)